MSALDDVSNMVISLMLEIVDISDKVNKMKLPEIESMIKSAFEDSKRTNSTMKKILGLEEMVSTLRQSITKASLKAMVAEDPVETKKEKALTVAFRALELRSKVEPTKKAPSKEEPNVEEVKPEPKTKKTSVKEEPKVEAKKDTKTKKDAKTKVESESDDESTSAASSDTKPLHVRRKKIPKHIRTLVWNEHIGSSVSENLCCCCKKEKIDVRNFHSWFYNTRDNGCRN
jgi:outer membrane biosynthesis protein TonB